MKLTYWISVLAAFTVAATVGACGAPREEDFDEQRGAGAAFEPGSEAVGELQSALSSTEVPVCTQRTAQSMTGIGETYPSGSVTMRMAAPGSRLYWHHAMVPGRWEFRIRARAHYAGSGYPVLRFWVGNQVLQDVVVDNVYDYETFSFEYDNPSYSHAKYLAIQLIGSPSDRDLMVDGADIVCPGVSCVDSVCTGNDVCCVDNTSGATECLDTLQCPFTSQGQLTQVSCDSHDDCGVGSLCVGVRFGNFELAVTCVAEEDWVPIQGSTVMLPICDSPGREPDPCPQGFSCSETTDILGMRTCEFD